MHLTIQGFTIETTPGISGNGPFYTAIASTMENGESQLKTVGKSDVVAIGTAIRELFARSLIRAWVEHEIAPHVNFSVTIWTTTGERFIGTLVSEDYFGKISKPYAIQVDTPVAGSANLQRNWVAIPAHEIVDIRNRN